jgi:hypothetical protein
MPDASKLWRWLDEHPWLMSIGLVLLIAVPGFVRIEQIAQEAHSAASRVEANVVDACKARNSAQLQDRILWDKALDVIESFGARPDILRQLRAVVPKATEVDRDCNDDGHLTGDDYDADRVPTGPKGPTPTTQP